MTRVHGSMLAGAMVLLAVAGFLVSRQSGSPAASRPATTVARKSDGPPDREIPRTPRRPGASRWGNLPELPPAVLSPHPPGSAENQIWIAARIAELDDAAWFDDSESMRRILAELHNPLPELRAAARAAITAFGSGDAVPYLEMTAATTYDETERQELTQVIDFLKLPTVTGHLEGQEQGAAPPPPPEETISQ